MPVHVMNIKSNFSSGSNSHKQNKRTQSKQFSVAFQLFVEILDCQNLIFLIPSFVKALH